MTKSIMQNEERCYICGRQYQLERHHVMSGTANRRLSEIHGLWVWLCHNCHVGTDGAQYDREKGDRLKQDAQRAFQRYYGRQVWMQLFKKNYLGGEEDDTVREDTGIH